MAAADYRLCDVCGGKAFYDSNLAYEFSYDDEWSPERAIEENGAKDPYSYALANLGSWAVVCHDCAKGHTAVVMRRGDREKLAALSNVLQPFITAHETGELESMIEVLDEREKGASAWRASDLLSDMRQSAIHHGLIEEGGSDAGGEAGSEDEWNRAKPVGSLAEIEKVNRG